MNILESSADFCCIGCCSIVILKGKFNASGSLLAQNILAGEISNNCFEKSNKALLRR